MEENVTFQIRVYMMQASQVPQEHEFDPTDDGYTRFHVVSTVLSMGSKKYRTIAPILTPG